MAVFLAAAGVLAFEVLLTRVFSVVMWYHFASMAIAAAMLGLSVGGLLPYFFRDREQGALSARLCAASALLAALPYGVLLLLARHPLWGGRLLAVFHQPYYEPFRTAGGRLPPAGDAVQIGLLLLLFSLPFIGAGAVFALAFSQTGREGRTYLAVMAGSAAGVLAYMAAMCGGSGPAAFLLLAALFAMAAAVFARPEAGGVPKRLPGARRREVLAYLALSVLLVLGGLAELRLGWGEIRFVRGRYEPALLWTRWDAASRVAVYPVPDEESLKTWGMSPAYTGPAPPQAGMVVDDTGYTALFGIAEDPSALPAFGYNIASAAYRIRGGGRALVIGPGGGKDILCALASGDFDVTAVEMNPLVVRAADVEFASFTGRPYRMPRVRAVVAEGRSFLAGDGGTYDVIQMTQVFGRVPPSAGAFTMTEDHLYTTEAFTLYLSRLSEPGLLSVTRFIHERRVWRVLAMAREALANLGAADPSRHVLALRDRGLVTILVRRTPWTAEDLAAARRFAREMRFDVILAPDAPAPGLPGRILAGAGADAFRPFDFSAPTDDRPFFYYTLSPRAFLSAAGAKGAEFDDRAVGMLRGFLAAAAILCVLFLVVPGALLARSGRARPKAAAASYMAAVGLAYIVWEIVMIKRLSLLAGAPVVAFAAGLTLILASSGLGGFLAAGPLARWVRPAVLLPATAAVSAYLLLAGPALPRWAGAPGAVRWAVAAAFVVPPSVLMGMFFPAGLRRFGGPGGGAVPFYFAVNGAASVLGAALAQALSLNLGYGATTGAGALLYLLGAVLLAARGEGGGAAERAFAARAALLTAAAALLLSLGCSGAPGAVEGTATAAGRPAAGAEVQAFVKAGAERSGTPFAATSAGPDGAYRIALPPGGYYLVARKTVREEGRDRIYKGEHAGNPVTVRPGARVSGIAIVLSEMSAGGFVPREGTGVTGVVTSAGRPAKDVHVYAYPAEGGTARGPSFVAFARTDGAGRFRLLLRDGSFLVVARKKGGEDETGAMAAGGGSGGEGIPVTLGTGAMRDLGTIALHVPREDRRRRRAEGGGQEQGAAAVSGTVEREDGSPAPGAYVMAYRDRRMIGRPFAVSGRTGPDGSFVLRLPRGGTFYLGARSERGGPVSPGEWVGTYDGTPDHAVAVPGSGERKGIRIRVVEKW